MEPTGFARKHRAQMIMEKLGQCDGIIKTCISICPDSRLTQALEKLQEDIVDVAAEAEMLSNGDESIQASRKPIKSGFVEEHGIYHNDTWKLEVVKLQGNTAMLKPVKEDSYFCVKNPEIDEQGDLIWTSDTLPMTDYETALKEFNYHKDLNSASPTFSSRKPIKSSMGENGFGFFKIKDYAKENNLDPNELLDMVNRYGSDLTLDDEKFIDELDWCKDHINQRRNLNSSMQGQERGIQAIMDEYGCTREEAIEIMNGEVTSGCHGKAKKKAKKSVKSSASSWDAGYNAYHDGEGYADYPTGLSNSDTEDWMSGWDYANREDKGELTEAELEQGWSEDDEERLRAEYAEENGLDLNEDIIDEDDYNEWVHRGAAMYSSVNRNHKNVQALYN